MEEKSLSDGKIVFKSNQKVYSTKGFGESLSYWLNDEEIQNDNKPISQNEFKQTIKGETEKLVNQNFDNIVVLVGAGASVITNEFEEDGSNTAGVTVAKIAEKLLNDFSNERYSLEGSDLDVFKLEDLATKSQYMGSDVKEVELKDGFNLEDFLSHIFAFEKFVHPDDKVKFDNTKRAILDSIKKATRYDYDDERFGHVKFLKVISKFVKSNTKLNIVTTNYDTLLEEAAESMKWTVFDGFSFSQRPQFDSTIFDWNLSKEVSNVKTHEIIYKKNVINLLKIHGSLTWERSGTDENIFRKNKLSVKDPIMVFPSSDKYAQSYQVPYFELFSKFQDLLKNPNTLLITIGFSFADNHIARMITSAIQTNEGLAVLVTDYDILPKNENWSTLETLMQNYYRISFLSATMNGSLAEYLEGPIHAD